MMTANPFPEHELMQTTRPTYTSKEYVVASSSDDSAWEKVAGTSMYRCTKCLGQEVKMSPFCPNCGKRMINFKKN